MRHTAIFTPDDFEEMLDAEFESPCGINITSVAFNNTTKEVMVSFEVTR